MNTVTLPAQNRLFGKYFEFARYNEVIRAMHGMLAAIPDGQACVLSSVDGHHLAHAAAPMLDTPRLAAVASSICGLGDTLSRDLGQFGLIDLTIQTGGGIAVIRRVQRPGQQLVLLTAAGHEADPVRVAELTRQCAMSLSTLSSPFER